MLVTVTTQKGRIRWSSSSSVYLGSGATGAELVQAVLDLGADNDKVESQLTMCSPPAEPSLPDFGTANALLAPSSTPWLRASQPPLLRPQTSTVGIRSHRTMSLRLPRCR
jgi:hypothetical protein